MFVSHSNYVWMNSFMKINCNITNILCTIFIFEIYLYERFSFKGFKFFISVISFVNVLTVRVLSSLPVLILKQYSTMSSPIQKIHSPRGDTVAHTKSPPSRLPLEKLLTIYIKNIKQKYKRDCGVTTCV